MSQFTKSMVEEAVSGWFGKLCAERAREKQQIGGSAFRKVESLT